MTKLTLFRYYFNKMDNTQREQLLEEMAISQPSLYRRLNRQDILTVTEAQAFVREVYKNFGIEIRIEDLTTEVTPQPTKP